MREILFKGKSIDSGSWVEGDLVQRTDSDGSKHCLIENNDFNEYRSHEVNPETVVQFIGLLDKNGKKIFEAGVVKDRYDRVMYVGNWNYRLCWIAITATNFHHADFFDWIDRKEEPEGYNFPPIKTTVEIIGNIHDNPELLK